MSGWSPKTVGSAIADRAFGCVDAEGTGDPHFCGLMVRRAEMPHTPAVTTADTSRATNGSNNPGLLSIFKFAPSPGRCKSYRTSRVDGAAGDPPRC